jgi:ribose transport system permease protein
MTSGSPALLVRARSAIVTLTLFALASAFSPRSGRGDLIFLSAGNLTDALRTTAPVGIVALAMTFVIISAGIDLSVGSLAALSGIISAKVLVEWKAPGLAPFAHAAMAAGLGIAACGAIGALSGVFTATLSIQPFVVTLAGMIGIRGLALWMSRNERIGLGLGQDAAGVFGNVLSQKSFMLGTWIVLAVILALVLNRTVFGRYVRAIGDNSTAASLAGLPVRSVRVAVYALSGLLSGVAGVLIAARTTSGEPTSGVALELDAIAVVVIGGASLAGGRGGILGTLNGALIIGIVTNILGLRNVDSNLQLVLKAGIIILAVALQRRKLSP